MESNKLVGMSDLSNVEFKVDTYNDINAISYDQLMDRIENDFGYVTSYKAGIKQQFNVMRHIFDWLGLEVNNEQAMLVMLNNKRVLCEAVAGSGKTTMTQMRIIRLKLFEQIKGTDILCLAYNDHACKDMIAKHSELVKKINGKSVKGIYLDQEIYCKTFHGYALAWVEEYKGMFNINTDTVKIMSELDQKIIMQKAIENAQRNIGFELDGLVEQNARNFMLFYSVARENKLKPEDYIHSVQFKKVPTDNIEFVEKVFSNYEKVKKIKHIYDFSDILVMFYRLLSENEDIRERIQQAYKVTLVDEYQDFTTIMRDCLALMISKDTYLTCVGDGDQSIYSFRGTDSLNCIKFRYEFDNAVIVSMSANRRCRDNIMKAAKNVIELNKFRNQKDLLCIKEGGEVINKFWTKRQSQIYDIAEGLASELKANRNADLSNRCICYRNKDSSYMITYYLMENRIPFTIGSGFRPFTDLLDKALMGFCSLMSAPTSRVFIKDTLFKFLPGITRDGLANVVDKEENKSLYFWEYDFNGFANINKFQSTLASLKEAYSMYRAGKPMKEYMKEVVKFLDAYYWNHQKKDKGFSPETEELIKSKYLTDMTMSQFISDKKDTMAELEKNEKLGRGIYISTFHGLKGLEFDEGFIIDLEDSIFPNNKFIDQDSELDDVSKQLMKQESVCLFYVAITRFKDKVTLFWNKENPSEYISKIVESEYLPTTLISSRQNKEIANDFLSVEERIEEPQADELVIVDDVDLLDTPEIVKEDELGLLDELEDEICLASEEELGLLDNDGEDIEINFADEDELGLLDSAEELGLVEMRHNLADRTIEANKSQMEVSRNVSQQPREVNQLGSGLSFGKRSRTMNDKLSRIISNINK